MNIAVIGGTGYVGLTTAVCLASKGHFTYCVGRNREKIEKINNGYPVLYEEGLKQLLKTVLNKRKLIATTNLEEAVQNSSISFICVGTPSNIDGSIDLSEVREVSKQIGRSFKKSDYGVVVVRSTVVPGTTETVVIPNVEKFSGKKAGVEFGACMNPEFLREGQAIKDFLFPKEIGIVIGELNKKSGNALYSLYKGFDAEIMRTDLRTAEMIKYARNSYLAKDVSFANEIANICQKCGADYLDVRRGMEMDARIGQGRFLDAGVGFGGSCFPKDVRGLLARARKVGIEPKMLKATLETNELQPYQMIELAKQTVGNLKGKTIAVLGLAFKPGTDDMREAVSIKIVNALLKEGTKVVAYDPQALEKAKPIFENRITYAVNATEALKNTDACLLVTEWPEFTDSSLYKLMRQKVIIDGRRALNPGKLPSGFTYHAIGFPGPVRT